MTKPKVPTQIVDKNGKTTTVHKSVPTVQTDERGIPVFRSAGLRPFVIHTSEESRVKQQVEDLQYWSQDLKSIVPEAVSVHIIASSHSEEPMVDSIRNKEGDDVWDSNISRHNDLASYVEQLDRFLRKVDFSGGVQRGYMSPVGNGFTIDLDKLDVYEA